MFSLLEDCLKKKTIERFRSGVHESDYKERNPEGDCKEESREWFQSDSWRYLNGGLPRAVHWRTFEISSSRDSQ